MQNTIQKWLSISIILSSLAACAVDSNVASEKKTNGRTQKDKLEHLRVNSYTISHEGFSQAVAESLQFKEEELYLPNGTQSVEVRRNTAKGKQKVMFDHISSNLDNNRYLKIPFTVKLSQYNSDGQYFSVKLATDTFDSNGTIKASTFDGQYYYSIQPFDKLYRTDGYGQPKYYTYNLAPLKLLDRFADVRGDERYKSGSQAMRQVMVQLDMPYFSAYEFEMNKPRNPRFYSNMKVHVHADPATAQKWVKEETPLYAYVKPAIILHVEHLKDFAVIYDPNRDVYVTEDDKKIVADIGGRL